MPEPTNAADWVAAGKTDPPAAVVETPAAVPAVPPAAVETTGAPAAVPGTPAPTPEATAAAVQEFLEAQVDGKSFQIPKNARLPWKRGAEEGFATIDEIQRAHMFEKDYTLKTMEHGKAVAQFKQERADALAAQERLRFELELDRVQVQKQTEYQQAEAKRLSEAWGDPEKGQLYVNHLQMLQNDPHYRKLHERDLEAQLTIATSEREKQLEDRAKAERIVGQAHEYISTEAAKYPGVDVRRVVDRYSRGVTEGSMPYLGAEAADTVDRLFQEEANYLNRGSAPLHTELQTLRQQVETLLAAQQAAAHNATVDTALTRTGRGPTTTTGAPPAPASRQPPKLIPSGTDEADQRLREWKRGT